MVGTIIFIIAFLFRLLAFGGAMQILHSSLGIGTSLNGMYTMLIIGTLAGTWAPFSKLKGMIVPACIALLFIGGHVTFSIIEQISSGSPAKILTPYALLLDTNLLLVVFAFAFTTTWLYWRVHHYATLEALIILLGLIIFFAPHRNFQLSQAPKLIQSLAWEANTSSFALIIISGGIATLLFAIYFGIASHANKPEKSDPRTQPLAVSGGSRPLFLISILSIILLLIGLTTRQVYYHYITYIESAGANGVGFQDSTESLGKSPLGFHSVLGSNNQPAAMVRLDGDYQENPFTPMLYLREGALSAFSGNELVSAGKAFDDDVTYSSPSEVFVTDEKMELFNRIPLTQSIYLLSEHETIFGVDYPLSIKPLENPAPQKFRGVYKVYSVAPTFSLEELTLADIGSSEWPEDKLRHYLIPHTDTRYANLAAQITDGITNPAERASALTNYLSGNAIYTLTPKHEIDEGEDPVAAFLFGDLRGYCVHFAHATVYMLRSLGIPARIATGYLTDLSQSKDGHILLRMSDRHAWAEAYFNGHGWVPFDTQPEQVESHADTEVDLDLLEELMGLVGNEKEFLPPETELDESGLEDFEEWELPSLSNLWYVSGLLALIFILSKIYLWYGWLLPSGASLQTIRGHQAVRARLIDLGYMRTHGETLNEHFRRMNEGGDNFSPDSSWKLFRNLKYAEILPNKGEPSTAVSEDLDEMKQLGFFRRIVAFFNPRSLFSRGL